EVAMAMAMHKRGEAVVIPVVLREVPDFYWEHAPFRGLQILPRDAQPVADWQTSDAAFKNISEGIARTVDEIKKKAEEQGPRMRKPPIYLAETSSELQIQKYREGIAAELEAHGYRIVPPLDVDLPDESPHYENRVRQYLETVKLSVHLIGSRYGRTIVGAND